MTTTASSRLLYRTILTVAWLSLAAGPVALAEDAAATGKIYLVGMGPGDREMVTLQTARLLKEADRVFCFEYLEGEVARFAPAEKITVVSPLLMARSYFKNLDNLPESMHERGRASQAEAARFLPRVRRLVSKGQTVVFAAAGDPTVYCPWSWLNEDFADLHPQTVPGLSSFNAASAALGQSITKHSGSVLISAGGDLGTSDDAGRLQGTLVLFTHRAKLDELLPRLQQRYPLDTPIAVVGQVGYDKQLVVWGTLGTFELVLGDRKLPQLYLIYVGDGLTPPASPSEAAAEDWAGCGEDP